MLRRPRDTLAFAVMAGAVVAIIVNGVYLQHGPHPAPIFAIHPLPVASARDTVGALARQRTADTPPTRHDAVELPRARPQSTPAATPAQRDAIADFLAAHPAQPVSQPPTQPAARASPAASATPAATATPVPSRSLAQPSRQVLAVQRALSEFGYGQIKPTGIYDADTRVALEQFQRHRRLPVTGEIDDAVKRELASLVGHSLD